VAGPVSGVRRLHQFIIGAAPGDAITDQALTLRRWLREAGFDSEVFAESIHPQLAGVVRSYTEYRARQSGELVVLHHSIGSDLVDELLERDVRFILMYHNITPPEFFEPFDPGLAAQVRRGRQQVERLRDRTILGLADSPFNEADLRRAGYFRTGVLPIVLDPDRYDLEPNPQLLTRYRIGGPVLLFVGRLVPHKRQEDLVRLLYCYHRIDPRARLLLVGDPWVPAYADWLRDIVDDVGLGNRVCFLGHVSQRDLVTCYRLADVYVSMSEHEGFGKPLIESMYLGVPVVAYAAGAVPATLGGAGVLFRYKRFEALAELVDLIVRDSGLRMRLVERQRERVREFLEPRVRARWQKLMSGLF